MSKLVQNDTKKAVERRNQAMRMNYTKVKPTVVKHILPNEVMQIHNPTVSFLTPYDTIICVTGPLESALPQGGREHLSSKTFPLNAVILAHWGTYSDDRSIFRGLTESSISTRSEWKSKTRRKRPNWSTQNRYGWLNASPTAHVLAGFKSQFTKPSSRLATKNSLITLLVGCNWRNLAWNVAFNLLRHHLQQQRRRRDEYEWVRRAAWEEWSPH